jgi:predicted ArsR family transcriptional regulator
MAWGQMQPGRPPIAYHAADDAAALGFADQGLPVYAARIDALDRSVGRIMAKLEAEGLATTQPAKRGKRGAILAAHAKGRRGPL